MILVDTNVLLAAADTSETDHHRCFTLLNEPEDFAITSAVAAETSWLMDARLGARAEAEFVASVAEGETRLVEMTQVDWTRCAQLVKQYADLRLGLVDASIVAVAERLKITTIATLNHRDFRVVRARHVDAFTLIP